MKNPLNAATQEHVDGILSCADEFATPLEAGEESRAITTVEAEALADHAVDGCAVCADWDAFLRFCASCADWSTFEARVAAGWSA